MNKSEIEIGQMWEYAGNYYVVLRPHDREAGGWYLFNICNPHDVNCWDYETEMIEYFNFVA